MRLRKPTRQEALRALFLATAVVWAATFVIAPQGWLNRLALVTMLAYAFWGVGRSLALAARSPAKASTGTPVRKTILPPSTKLVVTGLPGSMGEKGLIPASEWSPIELVFVAPSPVQVVGWTVNLGGARLGWDLRPMALGQGDVYRLPRELVLRGL